MPLTINPTYNTFTPVLTFATPGDLAVTYATQVGSYVRIGNIVIITINISTSGFTFTTASGACQVTGLPFTTKNVTGQQFVGAVIWSGVTKVNYTDVAATIAANASTFTFNIQGSGQATTSLAAADMPTGGSIRLRFTIMIEVQ